MLFRRLNADEIECRIAQVTQYGVTLLLYKDARCDMNILDETIGEFNWQRKHEIIDGRLYCSVGLYDANKNEWVWKQDVGTESYTEKEKGQASDSFKRSCFNWGIGRELYTAPRMTVRVKDLETFSSDGGRYTCKDYFTVTKLEYDGNRICFVEIRNERNNRLITFGKPAAAEEIERGIGAEKISETKAEVLRRACDDFKDLGLQPEKFLAHFGVKDFSELNQAQFSEGIQMLQAYEKRRKNGI